MPQPPATAERRLLDPKVWKACAGPAARPPKVGELVYYFPQGHAEQTISSPDLSGLSCGNPFPLCSVRSVSFLADPDTDEAFARILLDPRPSLTPAPPKEADDGRKVESFPKVLTPSDANNGGGFSVPRFCAVSLLPPLDLEAEIPVQNITVRDLHGQSWQFRHIYRGTPRRHLLTTGWSKFVNSKKLVAGDSIVFVRDQDKELFLGIRRTYGAVVDGAVAKVEEGQGFSRGVRGRVPPETVVEAIRRMEMGLPFEVLYYPRIGAADFLVAEEAVKAAMRVPWRAGLRVRMTLDTEDSTRTTWLQGMVSAAIVRNAPPWAGSPWRMLQVRWDDPDILRSVKFVNPWQVELVVATPYIENPYPVTKKLKFPQNPELETDVNGRMCFPTTGFSATVMGSLTPSLSNYSTSPAGMQGARHDIHEHTSETLSDDLRSNSMSQKVDNVSTELGIVSASQSQGSPPSQESIHDNNTEGTFLLFGQIIHTKRPINDDAK